MAVAVRLVGRVGRIALVRLVRLLLGLGISLSTGQRSRRNVRPCWLHRVGSAGQVVTWSGHFIEYGPTLSEECATSFEVYGGPCVGQVAPARYVPQTNPFVLLLAGIPQQIKRQEKTLSCLTQTGKGFS